MMRRVLASCAAAGIASLLMIGSAFAQTPGLNVTLPAAPAGTVTVTNGATACGTATVSASATTSFAVPGACATAGSTLTFSSNGQTIGTLSVPASGTGSLTLPNLNSGLTIGMPPGSGSVNILVNGNGCGSASLGAVAGTFVVPATCDIANGTITFRTPAGGQLATSLTIPASGTGALTLPNLNSPLTVALPAGSGSLNVAVNGQVCGTASLSPTSSTFTLPAACDIANGTLTFQIPGSNQLSTSLVVPASGSGTVTLSNLVPATTSVTLPPGPPGTITIMCGSTVGGTANISSTSSTTVNLNAACSIPGQALTLVGPANITLAGSVANPTIIAATSIVVGNLNSSTPLSIVLPPGSGTVSIMEGGSVCAVTTLSATSPSTVTLPITCQVPNQSITFMVNGTPSSVTASVPSSGAGSLSIALQQVPAPVVTAPAPAKTGTGGLTTGNDTFGVALVALFLTAPFIIGMRHITRR